MLAEVEIELVSEMLPPMVCPEEPERLKGAPMGQYHCPWCGCMQLAGVPHLPHDLHCWLGLWDGMP